MTQVKQLNRRTNRRRFRVRNHVRGNATRARLSVYRSNQNISVQLIDDVAKRTVASASTLEASIRSEIKSGGNKAAAQIVGRIIAERAAAAGVKEVCFDRGEFRYHGRVAALAEAARAAGLVF